MDTPDGADTFRILTWIGIIEQLQRTASERLLKPLGLSHPEFAMLNHFSHGRPPEKTVTGIAAAMQQLQPAVTKTVARLVQKGFVAAAPSATDGRSKVLTLTAEGRAAHDRAVAAMAPFIAQSFAGWSAAEAADLFARLDRLKVYLDTNR